jgi:branched-chain amino acid aminotransferase
MTLVSKSAAARSADSRAESSKGGLLLYLNGEFVPQSQASISVFDHGFLYGDGVFEGIAVYSGKPFRLEQHVLRFFDSAKAIDLQIPWTQSEVSKAIMETIRKNNLSDGYVRPIITRGIGTLGLNPDYCSKPTFLIIPLHAKDYPLMGFKDKTARAIVSTIRRNPSFCTPASAKTLNYLNNILAKQQANAAKVDEAIMLDWTGLVSEGTGDNLFLVKKGCVFTASLHCSILPGVTRTAVLDACRNLGVNTIETELTLHDLYTADEVFLTSTSLEIQPLVEIDGRKVGNGTEGKITLRIKKRFYEMIAKDE